MNTDTRTSGGPTAGTLATGASLAGALLLGCTLLAGCNKTQDATADQQPVAETGQPAADTAATGPAATPDTTSTAGTLPADTSTYPPTTMGNADDARSTNESGMESNGDQTDASGNDTSGAADSGTTDAETSDTNNQDKQGGADQSTPPAP